jgi:hypothetical protein
MPSTSQALEWKEWRRFLNHFPRTTPIGYEQPLPDGRKNNTKTARCLPVHVNKECEGDRKVTPRRYSTDGQICASNFFAPGGIPAAVRPAAITLRSTATAGDEICRNNPRWMAASNAFTAGPNLQVE